MDFENMTAEEIAEYQAWLDAEYEANKDNTDDDPLDCDIRNW
jgi:hypothetical protein